MEDILSAVMSVVKTVPRFARFLEEPAGGGFLLPATYALPKFDDLKAAGLMPRRAKAVTGSHVFDAVRIPFRDDGRAETLAAALTAVFGESGRDAFTVLLSVSGRSVAPLVVPKLAKVQVHDRREPLETDAEVKLRVIALEKYRASLESLSRLSGLAFHFHAETSGIRAPYPDEPGVIRIHTNACPPGQFSCRYLALAFGMSVSKDGLAVLANGPTKGRGVTLKDEHGEPLVQILGNNWYLLLPTLSQYHGQSSPAIFDRLLALAWKGHRDATAKPPKAARATRKAFAATVDEWTDDLPKLIREDIANIDRKIQDAQRDLADLTRRKKESQALLDGFANSDFAKGAKERAPKDWAAIARHPLVADVSLVEEGLHVRTVPIEIPHGGATYAFGAFTIRVSKRGTVSVWSEGPTHKDGIPHPHVAKDGGPCFGNASDAITRAGGEQRYADVIRYVLRWLTEGYTPSLAAVKIEEWPKVGEDAGRYETRHLVDAALGVHTPAGALSSDREEGGAS